jgi:deoxyribonuclease IV
MLIGAHVSLAGGLELAVQRGRERGCEAIQIFSQSPRRWQPSAYGADETAAFNEALASSPIEAVVIHAVYLLNCASEDPDLRAKSLKSLTHSLRLGEQIGARGVILHPGSAKSGGVEKAIARAGRTIKAALADSDGCELHIENTAGAGGTLGRSIDELEALISASGGGRRLGLCLDSCHLFASGYDIRSAAGIDALIEQISAKIGLERVRSLHLNDSQAPLGSNRDRHANIGAGELGRRGCGAFLAAPPFQGLACVLETPGEDHKGPTRAEVARARTYRRAGVKARTGARS